MIGELKPYAGHRDCGLPWPVEIPSHREAARSERLLVEREQHANADELQLPATQACGVIPQALYEERNSGRVRRGVLAAACVLAGCAAPPPAVLPIAGVLAGPAAGSLAPHAEWVVELRDAQGAPDAPVLAEARGKVAPGQPPIAFTLAVPAQALRAARAPVLRGAVMEQGPATWLSAPQPVPPDARAGFDAGSLRLEPHVHPGGFASRLDCGGRRVTIGFIGQGLRLSDGAQVFDLAAVPGAAPPRFELPGQPSTFVQVGEREATVSVQGRLYPRCVMVPTR